MSCLTRRAVLVVIVATITHLALAEGVVAEPAPQPGKRARWTLVLREASEFRNAAGGLFWIGVRNDSDSTRPFCIASAMARVGDAGVADVFPILPNEPRLCSNTLWTRRLEPSETLFQLVDLPDSKPAAPRRLKVRLVLFESCGVEGVCQEGEVELDETLNIGKQ